MLKPFLSGAISMACLTIGLFFFQFWRRTHDRLFVVFAAAFWLLMVERVILLTITISDEFAPYVYAVRLCAFALIIGAVVDKNRRA
ncbi:MAG: DUF5985 family protein [Verrucomicrobiota bacterium]|nr:DUF5985 family protein [Verrucomicrobiota bacterium]